jgi:Putative phage abortive infection protein
MAETTEVNRIKQVSWIRQFWMECTIVLCGLVFINLIFVPKAFRQSSTVNPESAAQLGSFVGGYFGSLFALVSVVLLFATLRSQRHTAGVQNFEAKYFELLRIQRDNVSEIKLGPSRGRRLFVLLIRELRCILDVVRDVGDDLGIQLTKRECLHIAYYCLFFGVGPNSSRMLKISLSGFDKKLIDAIDHQLSRPEFKSNVCEERNFAYIPFEGHQSRLGHYYRHLYQMVRYVDLQKIEIDKYEYVKTIRAQLSTHEQALLLINSLTPIGQNWWKKQLILSYRLVQNIPHDFFDSSTELDLEPMFPSGYFEWEEVGPGN